MVHKRAFTLIELLIVMGIIGIIFSFGVVSLLNLQGNTYLDSGLTTLISDIRSQQVKSMSGETHGGASTYAYGVRFESNRYILFRGTVYSPSDPANLPINLEPNIQFTNIAFPSSQVVFNKGSGEVNGFTAGSNSVSLRNTQSGEEQTLTVNRYGVITQVN